MARRINLVPSSERARTSTNVGMLGLVALIIIVLFGLGLGYYMLRSTLNDRKDELEELRQETQSVQAQVAALRKYDTLASEESRVEGVVQEIYAGRTLVSEFLNSFSLVIPENVWLSSLDISVSEPIVNPTDVDVTGGNRVSLSGQTYSFEDVAQLLVRLELIPSLRRIDLRSASGPSGGAGGGTKSFSITGYLNPPSEALPLPVTQVEVQGL